MQSKTTNQQIVLVLITMLCLALTATSASAHTDPNGCSSNGVGLSITVYRSDGITPVAGGSVESGETILYEATLSHLGSSNCNFENGTISITTPDNITHVLAVDGDISLISFGSPFVTPQQAYIVSEADAAGNFLTATARYQDGISHTGAMHSTAQANVNTNTPVEDISLEVSKTAQAATEIVYGWDISKTATPENWDLFAGDSAESLYTVDVTKTESEIIHSATGTITILNPAQFASATVTSVVDEIEGVGPVSVECTEELPYNLSPGENITCTYEGTLPDNSTRVNNVTVNTSGDIDGGQGQATIDFSGINAQVLNNEVTINDSLEGELGTTNESTTYEYTRAFSCNGLSYTNGAAQYTVQNVATVEETGAQDNAEVTVNCYELSVSKTADTTYERTYTWTIEKTADEEEIELEIGQAYTLGYDVSVAAEGSEDNNWAVSGEITINNPNPTRDAELLNVQDSLLGVAPENISCPTLTVPANDSVTCTYSGTLNGTEGTNEATTEQQNYAFDSAGTPTETNTTQYEGNTAVTFGEPTNTYDNCVDVEDTHMGYLGEVCANDGPVTFEYDLEIGPYDETFCGVETLVENTATYTTTDTNTSGDDNHTVTVTLDCPEGCTLTQGYWKTHSAQGPAPYDEEGWATLGDADGDLSEEQEQETFYNADASWYTVFHTTPKGGNSYYSLAHQYEAAVLNVLNGASTTPEVDSALAEAEALFNSVTPEDLQPPKGNKKNWEYADESALAKEYAGVLASYNEGEIGPGHCE